MGLKRLSLPSFTISDEAKRNLVGLSALAVIVVGIWALAGWPWGLIAAGSPGAGFYVWGEVLRVRGSTRSSD